MSKKSFLGTHQGHGQLDTLLEVHDVTSATDPVVNTTPASMTANPSAVNSDGYLRITIAGVDYQIPIYLE